MEININKKNKVRSGGIIVGLVITVIGAAALWWNEGRTVKTEGSIAEFEGSYIEIASTKIDASNDKKPIYTHGNLSYDENTTNDNEFEVNVNSAVLKRTVEMYQWEESCTTDSDNYETCNYNKVWSEELIDSDSFNESGHSNPKGMPYNTTKMYADNIKLDAFNIDAYKNDFSTEVEYIDLSSEVATNHNMIINGIYYTNVLEGNDAKVGDIRIKFTYNDAKELSILGAQNGNGIVEYIASNGYSVHHMREENTTPESLIQDLRDENNLIKWIIRIVGILFIMSGCLAIISPIQRLASHVPVLGKLFNALTGFAMALIGLCLSLVIIAIAWFRFRPILSLILITVVAGLIIIIKKLKQNKKQEELDNPEINHTEFDPNNNKPL